MLLTVSSGRGVPFAALTALLFLRAVALGVAELLAFLDGGRLDLGANDVLHGRDPVGDEVPLLAVPLRNKPGTAASRVLAGRPYRIREALPPKPVEALFGPIALF